MMGEGDESCDDEAVGDFCDPIYFALPDAD
jgi:hypothetical protein